MIHTIAYQIALYTSLTVVGIVLWFFLSFMLLVLIFLASVLSLIALMFILFFIGALAPGGHGSKIYAVSIIFPLTFLPWYTVFVLIRRFDHWFGLALNPFENNGEVLAVVLSLIIALLISAVVLRTVLAIKTKTSRIYVAVAMAALTSSSMVILLPSILFPHISIFSEFYFGIYYRFLIVLVPLMISGLGAILISTIRRPHQHIIVGVLAICVFSTIGWTVYNRPEEMISGF